MATNILMPALSPTMEEGSLAKWHVKEGDKVAAGDVIAEIETDKATMEVEAVDDGRIGRIVVPEGTGGVKVNSVIAVLLGEGEAASAAAGPPPVGARRAPGKEAAAARDKPSAPQQAAPAKAEAETGGRLFASPLARRLAKESGIDLTAVTGSGPRGRIVEADIKASRPGVTRAPTPAAPAAGAPPTAVHGMSDAQILALYPPEGYELRPHDSLRKIIARRLTEAKQTIPHFYLTIDLEIDALTALRSDINASAPHDASGDPAWKVSLNDMIIKAMAMALHAVPDANATWTEGGMLIHKHADVAVAVAIPGGLITPVVRHAGEKPLSQISSEMRDYIKRARERKLLPEEYQGGVTAISNLGMYGIHDFAAVINPPQSSILAVGAGAERPIVRGGKVEIATVMTATLSTDHRAVDGVFGAELLKAFKRFIEKPAGMLV